MTKHVSIQNMNARIEGEEEGEEVDEEGVGAIKGMHGPSESGEMPRAAVSTTVAARIKVSFSNTHAKESSSEHGIGSGSSRMRMELRR